MCKAYCVITFLSATDAVHHQGDPDPGQRRPPHPRPLLRRLAHPEGASRLREKPVQQDVEGQLRGLDARRPHHLVPIQR